MPIKIDIHDNTSQVRAKVSSKDLVSVESGSDIDIKRLESLIANEIATRIAEDAYLQEEIDDIYTKVGACYLSISENEDGSIDISLLSKDEAVLDTKTITLTEKIIKSAEVDYDNKKINYTCNDDSVIELDISSITDKIISALSDIDEIKSDIAGINNELSIINNNISTINNSLSIIDNRLDQHDNDIQLLKAADLSIIESVSQRVIQDLENAGYEHINPSNIEITNIDELLVYISKNGIPSYTKLNELGFARIRDMNDIDKVDVGDLLIDME